MYEYELGLVIRDVSEDCSDAKGLPIREGMWKQEEHPQHHRPLCIFSSTASASVVRCLVTLQSLVDAIYFPALLPPSDPTCSMTKDATDDVYHY